MSGAPLLEVEGLRKRLGRRRVLQDVSLRCGAAELLVITGENGSGKSTLLRALAGVIDADAGRAALGGEPLLPDGWRARRRLGYMPDGAAPLPDLQAGELVELTRALKGAPALATGPAALPERLGVAGLLGQRTSSLSLGQRRRLCLLLALLGAPALLLLDEPSDALDPDGAAMLVALLRERREAGLATLLTSNDAAFVAALAAFGARRLHLRDGALGPPAANEGGPI